MITVKKVWGREEIVCNGVYAMKRMVLDAGASCSFHYHPVKDETFVVESGSMVLEVSEGDDPANAVAHYLFKGSSYHIPPGLRHRFTGGYAGCVFYEASTRDDPADSIRLIPSRRAA